MCGCVVVLWLCGGCVVAVLWRVLCYYTYGMVTEKYCMSTHEYGDELACPRKLWIDELVIPLLLRLWVAGLSAYADQNMMTMTRTTRKNMVVCLCVCRVGRAYVCGLHVHTTNKGRYDECGHLKTLMKE